MRVNLYKHYFLSSLHFSIPLTKHKWRKTKYFLPSHFSILLPFSIHPPTIFYPSIFPSFKPNKPLRKWVVHWPKKPNLPTQTDPTWSPPNNSESLSRLGSWNPNSQVKMLVRGFITQKIQSYRIYIYIYIFCRVTNCSPYLDGNRKWAQQARYNKFVREWVKELG